MISKVFKEDSQEPYAKAWWPKVEPSMLFLKHASVAKLQGYMLPTRHGKDKKDQNLKSFYGETKFIQVLQKA